MYNWWGNVELVLTPEERKACNATTGVYYVCIIGSYTTTYKLTVENEDHDERSPVHTN